MCRPADRAPTPPDPVPNTRPDPVPNTQRRTRCARRGGGVWAGSGGTRAEPGGVRPAPLRVDGLVGRRAVAPRRDEPVADVAHRADERLVLDAQLRPEPAHVDVDRAGAAE